MSLRLIVPGSLLIVVLSILLNNLVFRVVSAIAACSGESHSKLQAENKFILADVSFQTI